MRRIVFKNIEEFYDCIEKQMDGSNASNLDDQKVNQICDNAIGRINARRGMVKKYLSEHPQEKSAMLPPVLNLLLENCVSKITQLFEDRALDECDLAYYRLSSSEGRNLVENYIKSDSEIPPNLSISKSNQFEDLEEIQPASSEELSQIAENIDPLEYGRFKNVEHILKQIDVLESINVDKEAIQFYLNYSIGELWKLAFENRIAEDKTVQKLRLVGHL